MWKRQRKVKINEKQSVLKGKSLENLDKIQI